MPKFHDFMTAVSVTTFRANGYGKMTENSGVEFRGCINFETMSQSLSALNGKALMHTYQVDASGNSFWSLWEPA